MSTLLSPLKVKSVTLRNRIVVSPMCQYSSQDGFASDWHLVHLGSRAVGGAGLIIQEATSISPEGRISPDDLGLWKDEHIDKLKSIVSFVHTQGGLPGIQLAHAGRKASYSSPWKGSKQLNIQEGGWQALAPSAIPFSEGSLAPSALSEDGIRKIIDDFRKATACAVEAGYDVLEIHAAHGYLLHEFLSPLTNLRNDLYGGPFENRISLLLEILANIQEIWPIDKPLFVRISASD